MIFKDSIFIYINKLFILKSFLISTIIQVLTSIRLENKKTKWLFFGEKDVYKKFLKSFELQMHELTFSEESKIYTEVEIKRDFDGLIIGDFEKLSSGMFDLILKLKTEGELVLSLISWSEIFFDRIPPSLFDKEDLFRDQISIPSYSKQIQIRMKRVFDIFFSILLIILSSPILIIVSFLIVLEDFGPILYSQERNGLGGRSFKIWKLRTMHVTAEKEGVQWVKRNDKRITKIGKFLRSSRIDELPQLFNILKGDMSLIGPRPEREFFDVKFKEVMPHYITRYFIKPGLSGWAQVNYPYGASMEDTEIKLSYDIYYLRNFSLLLDTLIIFKTIKTVTNFKNAVPKNR